MNSKSYENGTKETIVDCPVKDTIRELEKAIEHNTHSTIRLCDIVENKMGQLINVVSGRGMIPVDSVKHIIVFLLAFIFILEFGVESLKVFFLHLNGNAD